MLEVIGDWKKGPDALVLAADGSFALVWNGTFDRGGWALQAIPERPACHDLGRCRELSEVVGIHLRGLAVGRQGGITNHFPSDLAGSLEGQVFYELDLLLTQGL